MKGDFLFRLTAKRLQYEFVVKRKIMRITGDSAKGKTELLRAVAESSVPGTGTVVNCKYKCRVMSNDFFESIDKNISKVCASIRNHTSATFKDAMRECLNEYDNHLFFADEDFAYMEKDSFALFCKYTDSFFVLIRRTPLCKLPYSYTEIYVIKESGKFHTLIPKFRDSDFKTIGDAQLFIVEDSNSGYDFYNYYFDNVISAEGKSKIAKMLPDRQRSVQIVADGAAFGCEIENIISKLERQGNGVRLFLPESFEQLILASAMFRDVISSDEVLNPVHKITGLYFSWEQYFTELLIRLTDGLENSYFKRKLNTCYYKPCCHKKVGNCSLCFITDKKEAVLGDYLQNADSQDSAINNVNAF